MRGPPLRTNPPPRPPVRGSRDPPPPPAAPTGAVIEGHAEPAPAPARVLPDPNGQVGQALAAMHATDPASAPAGFLNGAEQAFRMIVDAFAKGDRATLKPLLSDATMASFEAAIAARE